MTQQYDNTNRGALFKNDRKEKDTHPDYKGSINVNGVEFWVSSWIKDGQRGKFMSLSITPKDEQSTPAPQRDMRPQSKPAANFSDDESDIPF